MEKKSNTKILQELMDDGKARVCRGDVFDYSPPAKPATFDFEKIEGMLLGAAIGDSLGITSEGMPPADRFRMYGEIRSYIPNRHVNEARGFPSDDTQLTFWTLEQLLEDGGFIPETLARRIAGGGRIFGIGSTVKKFLINFKNEVPWYESGPSSAGNGALMRTSPILIPHLRTGGSGIWSDAALAAMLTHNDYAAVSSAVAFTLMLWELLDMNKPPEPQWWVDRYVETARGLEGIQNYTPRGGAYKDFTGSLRQFIQTALPEAYERDLSTLQACNRWNSGAFLLETMPSVLYILMRHAHDPEEALVRGVNDTKDNDTIASIVGAAVGALHGKRGLPDAWIRDLSGRTGPDDDGKVQELIAAAKERFWGF
ncbi:MAG: ADP-ribosylglycohydrolase family protein [Spirochaetia bacterium]